MTRIDPFKLASELELCKNTPISKTKDGFIIVEFPIEEIDYLVKLLHNQKEKTNE